MRPGIVFVTIALLLGIWYFSTPEQVPASAETGSRTAETSIAVQFPEPEMQLRQEGRDIHAQKGRNQILLQNVSTAVSALTFRDRPVGLATDIVVVKNATVRSATIRLAKHGLVSQIVRCDDYDLERDVCPAWVRTDIPFVDHGEYIEFSVDHFTAYGGVQQADLLYVTSTTNNQNPSLGDVNDGAANGYAIALSAGVLHNFINASVLLESRLIRTTDVINFSSYWVDGTGVNTAYATFKLYYGNNINSMTLICQSGDDSTGGHLIPDGASAIVRGSCSPATNITVPTTSYWYVVNVWGASSSGPSGSTSARTANLTWDTNTANTSVRITSFQEPWINVTTNVSSPLQGQTVNASGNFYWLQNGTAIGGRNVTVTFYDSGGAVKQTRNVTTGSNGRYSDTYTIASDALTGNWSVNVTGWHTGSTYATNGSVFTVVNRPPTIGSSTITPNPGRNGTTVNVSATITDSDGISSAILQISYPNGTAWQNVSMENSGSTYWATFTSPRSPLGNHSIVVFANDTQGASTEGSTSHFAPFVRFQQNASIAIDGSFSDWNTLENATDENEILLSPDVTGNWHLNNTLNPPSGRSQVAMAFDYNLNKTIMFGGWNGSGSCDGSGGATCNGTYVYNTTDSRWYALGAATPPPARRYAAMVFDHNINKTILFGGIGSGNDCASSICSGTFAYNATDNTWYNLTPSGSPTGRFAMGITFDHSINKTIIFGGSMSSGACDGGSSSDCSRTYAYNGTDNTWYNLNPSTPPTPRAYMSMVFDRNINRTVLFGGVRASSTCDGSGTTRCNGTYAYNATENKWYDLSAADPPSARSRFGMVFDKRINKTILFGGQNSTGPCDGSSHSGHCNGTYVYNTADNRWTVVSATTPPSSRVEFGMVFDESINKTILFGGNNVSGPCDGNTQAGYCNGTYILNVSVENTDQGSVDILRAQLTYNTTHLASRFALEEAIKNANAYRLYSRSALQGSSTSPEGNPLPFNYTRYIEVKNNACRIYNSSNTFLGTCSYQSSGGDIEISAALSTMNLTTDTLTNVTWETLIGTSRMDVAPNLNSFVELNLTTATVSSPPTITLSHPLHNAGDADGAVTFNFTVSGSVDNCSLLINGTTNQTNSSINTGVTQRFIIGDLQVTDYNWSVRCTGPGGTTTSANRTAYIFTASAATYNLEDMDVTSASGFHVRNSNGNITWRNALDLRSARNLDSIVVLEANKAGISSGVLNSPANVTLSGLSNQFTPAIYRNGNLCTNCTIISYSGGVLRFNVSGFSNYTTGNNSMLNISDETDTLLRYTSQQITFFANYTNSTSNASINGTGINCSIAFNISGGWTTDVNMSFNTSSKEYYYNRSFSANGTFNYNVTCDGTAGGFELLKIGDTVFVNGSNAIPSIVSIIVNSTNGNNYTRENLTAYVTASDPNGDNVSLMIDWRRNGTSIAVLNYNFDVNNSNGTNSVKDYSTHNNNGSIVNALWNATGGWNATGAYYFDGSDDYIQTASSTSTNGNEITISAWVKPAIADQGAGYHRIVERAFNNSFYLGTDTTGTKFQGIFSNGVSPYGTLISTTTMTANQWYHVVITHDGTIDRMYINGVNEVNQSNTVTLSTAADDIIIGKDAFTSARYWTGHIDNVQIYNRSLSHAEIIALYRNRTDLIVSDELGASENWTACVTANDGTGDGSTTCSTGIMTINTAPSITSLVVNSSAQTNGTNENITAHAVVTDAEGDAVSVLYDWRRNGTSIAVVSYNFDIKNSNGTKRVKDYTSHHNNGSVTNAVWIVTGGWNATGTYDFQGSSDLITLNNGISMSGNWTITLWTKFPLQASGGGWRTLTRGSDEDHHVIVDSTGALGVYDNGGSNFVACSPALDTDTLSGFTHFAAVGSGTKTLFYINGVNQCNSSVKGAGTLKYVGNYQSGDQEWGSIIDNFAIWNRSLSEEQIKNLYRNHTYILDKNETELGENWTACVTANDGSLESSATCSTGLLIVDTTDSCTPPAVNNDWTVSAADNCVKSNQAINLGTGKLIVSGSSGTGSLILRNTNVTASNIEIRGEGSLMRIILEQNAKLIRPTS